MRGGKVTNIKCKTVRKYVRIRKSGKAGITRTWPSEGVCDEKRTHSTDKRCALLSLLFLVFFPSLINTMLSFVSFVLSPHTRVIRFSQSMSTRSIDLPPEWSTQCKWILHFFVSYSTWVLYAFALVFSLTFNGYHPSLFVWIGVLPLHLRSAPLVQPAYERTKTVLLALVYRVSCLSRRTTPQHYSCTLTLCKFNHFWIVSGVCDGCACHHTHISQCLLIVVQETSVRSYLATSNLCEFLHI